MWLIEQIFLYVFTMQSFFSNTFLEANVEKCTIPLGMEAGLIPDRSISASSSYESKSVGPQNGRIRQEKNGGAWCPKAQISEQIREYLEVDLEHNYLITRTETQGRFGNGQGQEYAETFLIEYWRNSLGRWVTYRDSQKKEVLKGNTNTYVVVGQDLELPFVASKIRFIPYSKYPRTVCMRVEIYGCIWEQNLIRYEVAEGEEKSFWRKLQDLSYDGTKVGGLLKGGLGQLVDGLYGDDFFDPKNSSDAGNRWIGWQNETLRGNPLEFIFEFDSLREFAFAYFYVNNMYTRSIQVFSSATIYFSLNGFQYQSQPIYINFFPDLTKEMASNVSIPLKNRIGKFVKIELTFSAKWILISEISFETVPVQSNTTEKSRQGFSQYNRKTEIASQNKEITNRNKGIASTKILQTLIGLILGILALVVFILTCIIFLMLRRGRKKVSHLQKHTDIISNSTKPEVSIHMKNLKMNMAMSAPTINSRLTKSKIVPRKKIKNPNEEIYDSKMTNQESESENSSLYYEPHKILPSMKQEYNCIFTKSTLSSQKRKDFTEYSTVNSFQGEVKISSLYNLVSPSLSIIRFPPYEVKSFGVALKNYRPHTHFENFYAVTDIIKEERHEQHFTLGKMTPLKIPDGLAPKNCKLTEFPRHKIRILEKLGEQNFGMIYLCEAEGIPDFSSAFSSKKKKLLLVKSLRKGVDINIKKDFIRESNWLACLKNPNLSRIIGICSLDEPFYALQEYSELGELSQFLKVQKLSGKDNNSLSYGCLIYIAIQITAGMTYLESLNISHRDLSARNCLVGKQYTIKVSDHAIYCNKYENDYYLSDTKARLPVRWMAWESLLLGKHTTKSDVWSFGVTLWEILMYCDQQPFAELTNEQVVENSSHWYQNTGLALYLQRPALCPNEVYNLMSECWKRQREERPCFKEIHLFLKRKNSSFLPKYE